MVEDRFNLQPQALHSPGQFPRSWRSRGCWLLPDPGRSVLEIHPNSSNSVVGPLGSPFLSVVGLLPQPFRGFSVTPKLTLAAVSTQRCIFTKVSDDMSTSLNFACRIWPKRIRMRPLILCSLCWSVDHFAAELLARRRQSGYHCC